MTMRALAAARPARTAACLALSAAVCTAAALPGLAAGPKFFADDPIWQEPVSQNVTKATRYEPHLAFDTLVNLFGKPGDPVPGQRAKNVNTVDEVPDGPFYANRAGRVPLTPELVARAANVSDVVPGPWSVISAKSDGITPGFTIRDGQNDMWFIKFDPPGWQGMATGAEMIASRLLWAVGYHTVEYHLARLMPGDLQVAPDATVTPAGAAPRRMRQADLRDLLTRADRQRDGSYRVIASKAAPGRPVGRIKFAGTRADDPNDVVPHEHRRELRGYAVFAAWLNHVDAKGINSLSTLVTENGRSFIRHYLLDFGSTLGSAAIGPREYWEGFEPIVEDRGEIARRLIAFGARVPEWRTLPFVEAPALGRLPKSHERWDPESWEPHVTNAAFRHARADDKFWAARKLTFVSDAIIQAAVDTGELGDPETERILVAAIRARRDRILRTYLPGVNPIVDPVLMGGALTFRNAAVDAGVADAPPGYQAVWSVFDNASGATKPLGDTRAEGMAIRAPALPDSGFLKVEIAATNARTAAWNTPVAAYFRRAAQGWNLVGFERLP